MNTFGRPARWFARAQGGASAVEFTIIAPILLLILSAVIDLGTLIYTRMQIESAISAATAYAFSNAESVSAENASGLGTSMTRLLVSRLGGDITANVVVNNGSSHAYANGQIVNSGSSGQANQCYCITPNGTQLNWSSNTCGMSCSTGGTAGRFISITVRKPYQPLFYDYGMTEDSQAVGRAVARVQ